MRILIVSDTHGFVDPHIVTLAAECDLFVHAGDICAPSGIDPLIAVCPEHIAVAGNNDKPFSWPRQQQRARTLPNTASLELPGGILAVEHGHHHNINNPCRASLRKAHPTAKVIVFGHTHRLLIDQEQRPWIINPGAGGRSTNRGGPSCLTLTVSATIWQIEKHQFPPTFLTNLTLLAI